MSVEYKLAHLSPYYQNTILLFCKNTRLAAASNTIQGGEVITFNTRLKAGLLFPLVNFPAAGLFCPFQKAKSKHKNKNKMSVTSVCAKRTGSDVSVFVTHGQ